MAMDSTVLIRIRHPDIDPDALTRAFGIEPEHSWKAGDPKPGSETTRRESYWVAEASLSPRFSFPQGGLGSSGPVPEEPPWTPPYLDQTPLERALAMAALPFMLNWKFWSGLRAEGATAQLIVVLGGPSLPGFELSHEVIAMLSRLGISLSVEFRDVAEAAA
jgi:Domain of unknown function (DUF4279)